MTLPASTFSSGMRAAPQGQLDVQDLAERLTSVRISRSKRHTGLITPASTVR